MKKTSVAGEEYLVRQLDRPPRLSMAARDVFTQLYAAHCSGDFQAIEKLAINQKTGMEEGTIRSLISHLRDWLPGKIFCLPSQISVEFRIPDRRPYHLEKTAGFSPLALWAAHIENDEQLLVHTFERLFFQHKTLYVRDTKVNNPTDVSKIARLLRKAHTPMAPTMHYVSSGELRAGLTLQDFFIDSCKKRARLSSGPDVLGSQNLILMGAARVESAFLAKQEYEVYEVVEDGVRPRFHDKTEDQHRTVHVLMSRRGRAPESVVTVLESSHGRAIQGLCERLVDPKNEGSTQVVRVLTGEHHALPDRFQIVFRATLVPSGNHVSKVSNVEIAGSKVYPQAKARRPRRKTIRDH